MHRLIKVYMGTLGCISVMGVIVNTFYMLYLAKIKSLKTDLVLCQLTHTLNWPHKVLVTMEKSISAVQLYCLPDQRDQASI